MSKASGVNLSTLTLLHGVVEAYVVRLASAKQVSDVNKHHPRSISWNLLIFVSVSANFM